MCSHSRPSRGGLDISARFWGTYGQGGRFGRSFAVDHQKRKDPIANRPPILGGQWRYAAC